MKLLFQIFFLLLTWFTSQVNATAVFVKVVFPNYEFTISKIENVKDESVVKITAQNFARSGIEENSFYQKSILRVSCALVGALRGGEGEIVQGTKC